VKTPTFNLRANILLDFVDVKINCSGVDRIPPIAAALRVR
jgi:hypothetical protein